ncbi:MAG: aldo/keto reductase [Bryobacteraceae bacterium]
MLIGHTTPAASKRYAARFGSLQAGGFYRPVHGIQVSSLGIGSYLGGLDEETDRAYTKAVMAAVRSGINFIDTSLNYRNQRSERAIGLAIMTLLDAEHVDRDELMLCTKAGFLVPGAVPSKLLQPEEIAGGMHCMAPDFLEDQLERSRVNLGVETIDVFYLHNPETQLQFVESGVFEDRVRKAFERLEELAANRKIQFYGTATWDGYRKPAGERLGLSLPRLLRLAEDVGGRFHHFRFVQLPFNLAMVEALTVRNQHLNGEQVNILSAAGELGIAVIVSASLMQARLCRELPDALSAKLGASATNAQCALQFVRSTQGVAVALAGMSNVKHVEENLGVALMPPLPLDEYSALFSPGA